MPRQTKFLDSEGRDVGIPSTIKYSPEMVELLDAVCDFIRYNRSDLMKRLVVEYAYVIGVIDSDYVLPPDVPGRPLPRSPDMGRYAEYAHQADTPHEPLPRVRVFGPHGATGKTDAEKNKT